MKRKLALLLSVILLVTSIVPMFIFEASAANAAPTVLPAIRSWTGGSGKFTPNASTVLVCNDSSASEQIKLVQEFFADMLGLNLKIATSGTSNAIIFKIDSSACNGEEEGYDLTATTSSITIKAKTKIGLLYGGITVVQSCYADGAFPVGTAKDWPEYSVRSGMLDVARQYIPMGDLYEVTKYMAWYKLNEFHVHLNDNGKNDYIAFRLECETYPELTSKDGHYTKEEYKQYQRDMAAYGITIISEIDSPYHSDCFRVIDGVKYLEKATLDLSDATTIQIMKNIWNEYTGGSDPVFVKKASGETVVHIGMDEYPIARKSEIIAYAQQIINLVNSNGYTARFWSGAGLSSDGVGGDGCLGGAKFTGKFQTNYWDFNMSGITETAAMNCPVVNNFSAHLYVVPGSDETGIDGFENKLNKETLKNIWNERNWEVPVGRWNGQTVLDADDPNLLGASFAIWNDWGSAWFGLTYRDIIDRFSLSACFIAEKTWGGSTTTFDAFYSDYEKLGLRAGSADPFGMKAYDNGDVKVDFSATFPKTYTASSVVNGEYVLDGTNPIAIGEGFAGFPNTISFDLTLNELPGQRTAIFSGYDTVGTDIYVDSDGTIGIKSKINEDATETKAAYFFSYDYKLSAGVKTNIKFTCDGTVTTLIINNALAFTPNNSRQSEAYFGSQNSPLTDPTAVPDTTLFATLTIPLEKVGAGLKGKIDNINITNKVCDIPAGENIALNKTYTTYNLVNGVVTDENKISRDYGAKLTDGTAATTQVVADWFGFFDNAGVPDIENCESGIGYVLIDLGANYDINKIKVHVRTDNAPSAVTAYVSNEKNGTYTKAATLSGTAGGTSYWLNANTSGVSGRYVKIEVKVNGYWALFNEIEVYGTKSNFISHDALSAAISASRGFAGTTSWTGIVAAGPASLVDGLISDKHSPTSGEWYVFQTKMNTEDVGGGWGNVGRVEVDLGKEIEIEKIQLHLANSTNLTGVNASITEIKTPSKIEVYAYVNGGWQLYGTAAIKSDANVIYWSDVTPAAKAANVTTSKIRVDVTIAAAEGEVVWGGLMDEIAVYKAEGSTVEPSEPVKDTVEHIAVGKPVSVSGNFNGQSTSGGVIGVPAVLTDGSIYDRHDDTSGNWMIYQSWVNSTAGNGKWGNTFEAIVDLQGEYVINSVKVHLTNTQDTSNKPDFTGEFEAPKSVEAFALIDGEWKSIGTFVVNASADTYWAEVTTPENTVATQIKIVTTLNGIDSSKTHWGGLMDEIAVYGTEKGKPTYNVTFDANGGSGEMEGFENVSEGGEITLPECGFTAPEGMQFKAWNVNGTEMAAGKIVTVSADLTVYAVWEEAASATVARLLGDVNNDGVVDKKDFAALKRYCLKISDLDAASLLASDVNQDTIVDKKDFAALKRFWLGKFVITPEYIQVPVVTE